LRQLYDKKRERGKERIRHDPGGKKGELEARTTSLTMYSILKGKKEERRKEEARYLR